VRHIGRRSRVLAWSRLHSRGARPDLAHPSLAAWNLPEHHAALASLYSFTTFPPCFSLLIKAHLQLVCPTSHPNRSACRRSAGLVTQRCPRAGDARVPSAGAPAPACSEPFCAGGRAKPGSSARPQSRLDVLIQRSAAAYELSFTASCPWITGLAQSGAENWT